MKLKYYGVSQNYGQNLKGPVYAYDLHDSPEDVRAHYSWIEDLEIKSVDTDDQEFILRETPPEFRSILSYMAYERGHSAGESEVARILRELVYDLTPAINEFAKRIRVELAN